MRAFYNGMDVSACTETSLSFGVLSPKELCRVFRSTRNNSNAVYQLFSVYPTIGTPVFSRCKITTFSPIREKNIQKKRKGMTFEHSLATATSKEESGLIFLPSPYEVGVQN